MLLRVSGSAFVDLLAEQEKTSARVANSSMRVLSLLGKPVHEGEKRGSGVAPGGVQSVLLCSGRQ